jgi:hypothetical protein
MLILAGLLVLEAGVDPGVHEGRLSFSLADCYRSHAVLLLAQVDLADYFDLVVLGSIQDGLRSLRVSPLNIGRAMAVWNALQSYFLRRFSLRLRRRLL